MTKVTYDIVEHDGGWAYRANGTFSETFASHDEAAAAASRAAREQRIPGESEEISYQDPRGEAREETASGADRPDTEVVDRR